MPLAQSLIEYTSISSLVATIQEAADSVLKALRDLTPQTWLIICGIAVLTMFLFNARNRRRL
jgi:hypothetical protein